MTPEHKALVEALTRKAETDGLLSVEDIRSVAESLSAQCAQPQAGEPVQDTWFTDRALPVMAMSADVEDNRVLKLHFRRPVTDGDRKTMCDALNVHQASLASPQPANPAQGVSDEAVLIAGDILMQHGLNAPEQVIYQAARAALTAAIGAGGQAVAFQQRVQPWMMACFGPEISADKLERADRFIEEAIELVQSGGYPRERVAALTDYVYGREIGRPAQEVGGVMVTLAAYCLAHDLDMHECGETELARIWTKIEKIRAKQAAKPTGSALPVALSQPHPADERVVEALRIAEERLSSLLARIHRDGGHYEAAHGTEKAWADADEIVARIYADDTHPAHSPATLAQEGRNG